MIERALPLVILALGGFYLSQAWQLPVGAAARPGAGFYPVGVAVFACIVGLAATVQAFRAPARERVVVAADAEAPARRRRVLVTVAALVAFCFAMPSIGYPLAAAAFVTVVLRGLGSRWPAAVAIGVLSAAASQYLFAVLLDVPLPRGPW
jgi:putative tricarboxylic transport membrane protein